MILIHSISKSKQTLSGCLRVAFDFLRPQRLGKGDLRGLCWSRVALRYSELGKENKHGQEESTRNI